MTKMTEEERVEFKESYNNSIKTPRTNIANLIEKIRVGQNASPPAEQKTEELISIVIECAIENNKRIDGKDPILWAAHKGIKIDGKDPILWAAHNRKKIGAYDKNPIEYAILHDVIPINNLNATEWYKENPKEACKLMNLPNDTPIIVAVYEVNKERVSQEQKGKARQGSGLHSELHSFLKNAKNEDIKEAILYTNGKREYKAFIDEVEKARKSDPKNKNKYLIEEKGKLYTPKEYVAAKKGLNIWESAKLSMKSAKRKVQRKLAERKKNKKQDKQKEQSV